MTPPPDLDAPDESPILNGRKVLVGVTGGIAAYKAALLIRALRRAGASVQVVMTPDAERFVSALTLGALADGPAHTMLWPERAESGWTQHVHLGLWADLMVIAPATAQSLFKLAHGACDNLLTAVALSLRCPLIVCPAMDHDMFGHPATQANLDVLRSRGVRVMPPEVGPLASGLVGQGRLPEPERIVRFVADALSEGRAMQGRRVLVTAGPTREHVDPVRFLSNPSTGTMGFTIAAEAARRGADVTLVAGPVALATPPGCTRIDVTTAAEMHAACLEHAPACDLVVMTAAVADYAPAQTHAHKLKKGEGELVLRMVRTPDILADLGARKPDGQTLVGFAMETQDGEAHARAKLERKGLDAIVLNMLGESGAGFGSDTNRVTLIRASGEADELPLASKADVARMLLDRLG
jgi:phosphopantothenoylcysteine decarboxylase/phosphopantothenate--cysteine ligase